MEVSEALETTGIHAHTHKHNLHTPINHKLSNNIQPVKSMLKAVNGIRA